jgi:predicted transcriptional regulator
VNAISRNFLLPFVFGTSRRIYVLEILLKNFSENENNWLNLSEIARIGEMSTSTAKKVIDELLQSDLITLRENTYQTPVKNPLKEVHLNSISKITKELIFFYQKLRGLL